MRADYSLAPAEIPIHEPAVLSAAERALRKDAIRERLAALDAVLVAHYYVDGDIQDLALETGGCVSDSLEMARFGRDHPASTLVVAGVRFMGETAKILSPEKRVLMPTLEAECSLDIGCPPEEFEAFAAEHPDRTVVVYANTSVHVKAMSDWVVTSSIGLRIVEHSGGRRREDPVGARQAPRELHPPGDRGGHAALDGRLRGARRVQVPGPP